MKDRAVGRPAGSAVFWAAGLCLLAGSLSAQMPPGNALVKSLRRGGYVIVMRHASSPPQAPDTQTANPDNLSKERQLDDKGRSTAVAMGGALRALKIPIGQVLSSPTYRALETVRLARLGEPKTRVELGDNGKSMQGGTETQAAFLRARVAEFPRGTNTIIVTHLPNITSAFPQDSSGVADGEALVFGPDGKGGAHLVARIKIEQWAGMER